jgi:hypothetical protein
METKTDDTWTWTWNCGTFAEYLIWRNSPDSVVWIFSDISWRNFQWRYVLLATFHDEKNDMQIFKNSHRYCDRSPTDVLVE